MSVQHWSALAARWSYLVFGDKMHMLTPKVRCLRLLEEVIELCQSENVLSSEVQTVMQQVYSKPKNPEPLSELGGVMTTLAAYAGTTGYNIEEAFFNEFLRIMDPVIMDRVRHRNLSGDKIGFNG
jgi:hypothetical protein